MPAEKGPRVHLGLTCPRAELFRVPGIGGPCLHAVALTKFLQVTLAVRSLCCPPPLRVARPQLPLPRVYPVAVASPVFPLRLLPRLRMLCAVLPLARASHLRILV